MAARISFTVYHFSCCCLAIYHLSFFMLLPCPGPAAGGRAGDRFVVISLQEAQNTVDRALNRKVSS